MIYRFVPGFGDEIAASRNNRLSQGAEGRAAAVLSSPAALVSQGIKAHSGRQSGGDGGGASQPRPANQASGGMAAHASRGGSGGSPSAPPPRSGNPVNSPHMRLPRQFHRLPRSGGDGR